MTTDNTGPQIRMVKQTEYSTFATSGEIVMSDLLKFVQSKGSSDDCDPA